MLWLGSKISKYWLRLEIVIPHLEALRTGATSSKYRVRFVGRFRRRSYVALAVDVQMQGVYNYENIAAESTLQAGIIVQT